MAADTFWNRLRSGKPPTYEVLRNGASSGPFKFLEIRHGIYNGKFGLKDSYRRIGADKWKSLGLTLARNRLFETYFFGVYAVGFILAGLWLIWFCQPMFRTDWDSFSWPSVPGKITFSQVDKSAGDRCKYVPRVSYNYRVASKSYFEETIYPECVFGGRESWAKTVIARHPMANTTVYYMPGHPKVTVLEPGLAPHSFVVIGGGLMSIYTGVLLGFLARSLYRKPLEQRPSKAGAFRGLFFLATIAIGFVFVCWLP
jgi:hypothetical protein